MLENLIVSSQIINDILSISQVRAAKNSGKPDSFVRANSQFCGSLELHVCLFVHRVHYQLATGKLSRFPQNYYRYMAIRISLPFSFQQGDVEFKINVTKSTRAHDDEYSIICPLPSSLCRTVKFLNSARGIDISNNLA